MNLVLGVKLKDKIKRLEYRMLCIQFLYFTTEVAIFGLLGFTIKERLAGEITTSMSSIGTEPSNTSSPNTNAPVKHALFLNLINSGPM